MQLTKLTTSGDLIVDRRYTFAKTLMEEKDWQAAADLLADTVRQVPEWAPAWVGFGDALAALGRTDEAREAFATALKLSPDDELGAGLRLARLGALPAENAMSVGYVRALFDEYAGQFDAHLREKLAYRGPELLRETLLDLCRERGREPRFRHGLDLGCGTGLMGEVVRPHVDVLAGCDLSPRMVDRARRRGCYDRLAVAELTAFLEAEAPGSADLVLAADVVIYIGDLAPVIAATARVLAPGGLFLFTTQAAADESVDCVLGEDMRFAHGTRHLQGLLADAGLETVRCQPAVLRHDAGKPVEGVVLAAAKPGEGA